MDKSKQNYVAILMISESQKLDFPGLFSSSGFRTEKQQTSQTKNLKKHCIFNSFGKHKRKNAQKPLVFVTF